MTKEVAAAKAAVKTGFAAAEEAIRDAGKLSLPIQIRTAEISSVQVRKTDDGVTRFSMSLSSEYPVDRFWGTEILSHAKDAVRLDRAKSGAMPLLWNHNADDPVGMVDGCSITGKRLMIEGSFFTTQRAQDVAAMVAGGLRNVSVGYRIHAVEENVDEDQFTVTDWEPYEGSIAPVPADPTVGNGRAAGEAYEVRHIRKAPPEPAAAGTQTQTSEARQKRASSFVAPATHIEGKQVTPEEIAAAGASAGTQTDTTGIETRGAETQTRASVTSGPSALDIESQRVKAIQNLCKANSFDANLERQWISSGMAFDKVSDQMLRIMEDRGKANEKNLPANLGMSDSEVNSFSICRAVLAAQSGDWRKAGLEATASEQIARNLNRAPDGKKFFVPYDVMRRSISQRALQSEQRALRTRGLAPWQTRADNVATGSQGGFLVETVNMDFVTLLRNRSVCYRLGARPMSGLVGNVNVPKQTGAATGVWMSSETATLTESEQTFGQLPLSPHTVGAYTEVSRLLMLQSSPDVEGVVTADLAAVAALAVDKGGLQGSGSSGQPTGITNISGVGTAASGDMATIAYKGQLDFQVAVANANVTPVRGAYATTPTVASLLMQRNRFANTMSPLWDGNLWDATGPLGCAGFPGMSSLQIPASGMIFGDWDKMVIAEWGVLEIEVNPYATFQSGIIGIRSMVTVDIGLRYPAAFCIQGANIT